MKPRALLVCDRYGWANEQAVRALSRFLVDDFEVHIASNAEVTPRSMAWADILYSSIYYGRGADHPLSVTQISSPSYFLRRRKRMDGFPERLRQWTHVVAKNREILGMLSKDDHPSIRLLYHHLDPWTFRFGEGRGYRPPTASLVVGYAGHGKRAKGIELIREAASLMYPRVELHALTFDDPIPPGEMPDWYRGLDVYVCASKPGSDAGPRPPMEAGLCGCAIVTTSVGQIGEMVEDGVNGMVVDWTAESVADAFATLAADRTMVERLGLAAAATFRQRWAIDVGNTWRDYFLEIL